MNTEEKTCIRDARELGVPKMLLLGLQHMFAMFGATILSSDSGSEHLILRGRRGLSVSGNIVLCRCWYTVLPSLYEI